MSEALPNASWTPVTRSELDRVLDEELAGMVEEYRILYGIYAVEPRRVACAYLGSEERFFVVSQRDERFAAYNDVEELFGIGTLTEEGPVTDWADHGPLAVALCVLVEERLGGGRVATTLGRAERGAVS